MISRHPHVFDPEYTPNQNEGRADGWEARKAQERNDRGSVLGGIPKTLPALLRAHRMTEKASNVGFDWSDISGVHAKLDEELGELAQAIEDGDTTAISHEYGDVLFTLVNLGRFLNTAPESALQATTNRFERRFRYVEAQLKKKGQPIQTAQLEELEMLWVAAKEAECSSNS